MSKKIVVGITPLLLLAGVILGTVPCGANVIPISAVSDTLTVLLPNGSVFATLSATSAQKGPNGAIFVLTTPRSVGALGMVGKNIVFCENAPCNASTPASQISKVFSDVALPGSFNLSFASDAQGGISPAVLAAFGGTGVTYVVEKPGVFPYDVSSYLDPGLRAKGWTAWFTSDGATPVPEPSSLMLFGTGLLAVGGVSRRLMRK